MKRQSLDTWAEIPQDMRKYLQNYGYHFNGKIYRWAVSQMYKKDKDGKKTKIEPIEKEKVDELFKKYNITLENNVMYDAAYLYSMGMSDYMGTAFTTEEILAKWIKATLDDVDKNDGFVFNRFYADCCFSGTPIDWEEFV